MKKNVKLLVVAGARPNFMKIAPLIWCIREHNESPANGTVKIECKLVHTGQHYDAAMSQVFFDELGIPTPDFNLEVGSGSHAAQTAEIMKRFEPVCAAEKPDWLVVVGDVNSTMACTLVASKMGTRVAHVEAGLRSFDRTMPEEINRIVTDSLADLLLTPSEDAGVNLQREGVPDSKIRCVGNVMIDSLMANLNKFDSASIIKKFGLEDGKFIYVTLHRPSNVDEAESLGTIVRELTAIAGKWPVVFPVHPRTRKRMEDFGLLPKENSGMKLLGPVGYQESLALTRHARCVLTDSGGLQEESTYFRTPCLTLRPNTERPVTISIGSNKLTAPSHLRADLEKVLKGDEKIGKIPPLWDGKTAERIIQTLIDSK